MTAPNCLDSICASILRYLRKIVIDYSISEINSRGNSGHWDGLGNPYYLIFKAIMSFCLIFQRSKGKDFYPSPLISVH